MTNPQPDEIEQVARGGRGNRALERPHQYDRWRKVMGEKPSQTLIHFEMDGESYAFIMPAESWDDAERRMRAIRLNGRVAGWPCYSHSTNTLTLPFVAAWAFLTCSFRNLFGRKQ
jgi:hypothetical protein